MGKKTVILGGLALPAYHVLRSTLDLDISIWFTENEALNQFIEKLKKHQIKTTQEPKLNHDLFTVFGAQGEAEIWLRPCDAFPWDQKMHDTLLQYHHNIYVLSKEDFILTKLARADRSSIDFSDIIQILVLNFDNMDWSYLKYRLQKYKLFGDFLKLLQGYDENKQVNNNIKKIVNSTKEALTRAIVE